MDSKRRQSIAYSIHQPLQQTQSSTELVNCDQGIVNSMAVNGINQQQQHNSNLFNSFLHNNSSGLNNGGCGTSKIVVNPFIGNTFNGTNNGTVLLPSSSFNGMMQFNNGHHHHPNQSLMNNVSNVTTAANNMAVVGTWNKYKNNTMNTSHHSMYNPHHHRSVSRLYNYTEAESNYDDRGGGIMSRRSVSRSVSRSKRFLSKGIKRLTYRKRRRGQRSSIKRSNTTLTKTRLKELLISNQGIIINYPIKTVIALGISLTLLGIIMSIFSSLGYLLDASPTHTARAENNNFTHPPNSTHAYNHNNNFTNTFKLTGSGTYIGITVSFGGLLAIISAKVPSSSFAIHCNLFFAILTIASTGFMTIITANSVFKDSNQFIDRNVATYADALVGDDGNSTLWSSINYYHDQEQLKSGDHDKIPPSIFLDTFILIISSLTSLVAFVNCCLTAREACQCYNTTMLLESKYIDGHNGDPIASLGLNTLQRRERILKWIIQQSSTIDTSTNDRSTANESCDDNNGFDTFNDRQQQWTSNSGKRMSLPNGQIGGQQLASKRPLSPPVYANYSNYDYRSKYQTNFDTFNNSLQRMVGGNFNEKTGVQQPMYQVLNISAISCPPGQRGIMMSPSISMSNLVLDANTSATKFNFKRSSVAVPPSAYDQNRPKYQSNSVVSNRISAYDY